jgi:hypothetical protein
MATYIQTTAIAGARLNNAEDTQHHTLGERVTATDGTTFIYVQADGAISAGDTVTISPAYQCTRATIASAMLGHQLAFAQIAAADNDFFWVPSTGNPLNVLVSATSTLNVALYIGTTSGHLSTTAGSATVAGLALMTANTSTAVASFTAVVSWPRLRLDGLS